MRSPTRLAPTSVASLSATSSVSLPGLRMSIDTSRWRGASLLVRKVKRGPALVTYCQLFAKSSTSTVGFAFRLPVG